MPAQLRRRRHWSVAIAVLAIILGGAVVGAHATSSRSASARAVVTSVHLAPLPSARAVDLHAETGPLAAATHTDLSTPPEPAVHLAAAAHSGATPASLVSVPSPTSSENSGRAPPTV